MLRPHGLILLALSATAFSQTKTPITDRYTKLEQLIPMRDGTKLHTAIYIPKDKSEAHPFLMERTPYGCWPYGKTFGGMPTRYTDRNYIMVFQDVRGRYMSEGEFEELKPQIREHTGPWDTDESTDTYDTLEWLTKNVQGNNGKAGIYGVSYPGGYAALGALCGHPAMVAASPQAPTTDWFRGDDAHHNGAFYLQDNFSFYTGFLPRGPKPTLEGKWVSVERYSDSYDWYLKMGPIKNFDEKYFKGTNRYWSDIMDHPNYDEFWQSRTVQTHFKNVKTACLFVGGFFDAEDMFGPMACFKENEKGSPGASNQIVMGPWSHGMWAGGGGQRLGDQDWGSATSKFYQDEIELPFFELKLRGKVMNKIAKATMFDSGAKQWKRFTQWPPKTTPLNLSLDSGKTLTMFAPKGSGSDEYISDPAAPTPYQKVISPRRRSEYILDDQTFASKRDDVLTYSSPVLDKDLTLAGPVTPDIFFTTTGTDADIIVKLIDESPAEAAKPAYQMMVRGDVMRTRFRNSLSNPRPLTPGKVEEVKFDMVDTLHTFKKGHRIMVQIQSSWFPLVDRNPNQFVNIYEANAEDFIKATIGIRYGVKQGSKITVGVLP